MTVLEILEEFKDTAYNARRLGEAVDVMCEMVREKATIFLGLAGAMVPAGMKGVVIEMLRNGLVNVIVSTGANMVHDALEASGGKHYKGDCNSDDRKLFEHGISRIHDVFIPEADFAEFFDKPMQNLSTKVWNKIRTHDNHVATFEFFYHLGKELEGRYSILSEAYKYNVPIYIPAIQDSCYGLLYHKTPSTTLTPPFHFSATKDLTNFFKHFEEAEKIGALIIGGGVPKNFIFQAANVTKHRIDYAIQITMDRPEHGGLSGATLDEATSWGKINTEAKKVMVFSDATICFPLLIAAVLEKLSLEKRI